MADRTLIVTADDFGLDVAINDAVEEGFRRGILTCASLMVAAPAAQDAVDRARRLPDLGVGLHLTLVDGAPVLPAHAVPALLGRDGRFPADPLRQGVRLFCSRGARAQAIAEIRAQFEAFRATGLPLDHVNAHHHFHLHPTVQRIILRVARDYGVRAVRVPGEPRRSAGLPALEAWLASRQARRLRQRLRQSRIAANDAIFGERRSGRMTGERLHEAIAALPLGISELYLHPVARPWRQGDPWPPDYDGVGELRGLLDPLVRESIAARGIRLATFAEAWAA
jgi:hopanoid biosynthesis associated protein HpnK